MTDSVTNICQGTLPIALDQVMLQILVKTNKKKKNRRQATVKAGQAISYNYKKNISIVLKASERTEKKR